MRLEGKQREIALFGQNPHRWTLVSGPVGSGKTHAGLIGALIWQARFNGAEFGILTKGRPQLMSVLKGGFERILDDRINVDSEGGFTLGTPSGGSNQWWCFVGQDARSEARMRSFNLTGMVMDEMTTLPYGLIVAANARCRVGPSKLIGLTNPDGPLHPVKKQLFDVADRIDGKVIETELADNPTLSESYIKSLHDLYKGHMLDRMVYGKWVAAEGLVYPLAYGASLQPPDEDMAAYDVVVDVGESAVTHALLAGRTTTGKTWILDEWRYDHLRSGVLSVRAMVAAMRRHWADVPVHTWIVDPAALGFRQELLAQTRGRVGKAENDWDEGVQEVNHWLGVGALKIHGDAVPELMRELGELTWDADQGLIGKDVPVKSPDHGTDALRYLVLTRAIHEAGGREVWEANRRARMEVKR